MEDSHEADDETVLDNAKKIMKFILNSTFAKMPFKRSEILANCVGNKALFEESFSRARVMLKKIYGLQIHEVPDTKANKLFIAASLNDSASILEFSEKQQMELNLLFVVLSFVFMKGERVNEEAVFSYLTKLKIPLDVPNDTFPFNVKKTIKELFVKQLYLKRDKVQAVGVNEAEYFLSWGFRADVEFSKERVLNVVANILQKPAICFVKQYAEVAQNQDSNNMEVDS